MNGSSCLVRIIGVLSLASLVVDFQVIGMIAPAPAVEISPAPKVMPVAPLPAGDELPLKDILFDPNEHNIRTDAEPVLVENAQILKELPNINVMIEGYADIRGEEQYNLRLAQRRADATKAYLVKLGIEPDRIDAVAKGASTKFSSGSSDEDFQLNRRAHFNLKAVETSGHTESSSPEYQPQPGELTQPISIRISKIIEEKLKELAPEQIPFNPPREMTVGKSERVTADISSTLMRDVEAELDKQGFTQAEKIKLEQVISLKLSGYNFDVNSSRPDGKPSEGAGETEWGWDVTPLKSGLNSLLLTATVGMSVNNETKEEKEYPLYVKAVNVEYRPIYSASRLIANHWYWFAGTLIVLGLILWTVRKRM